MVREKLVMKYYSTSRELLRFWDIASGNRMLKNFFCYTLSRNYSILVL